MLYLLMLSFIFNFMASMAQNSAHNRLVFDVTTPINDLIVGKLTKTEFVSSVFSAFGLSSSKSIRSSTFLFVTDGDTLEEIKEQTLKVAKIYKETIGNAAETKLLIIWTVNTTKLDELRITPYNVSLDGFKPAIIISLKADVQCSDVSARNMWHNLLTSNTYAGIGFQEAHIDCYWMKYLVGNSQFVVVTLKFGNTFGVPESFGLFQIRMKLLSEQMIRLSEKSWFGSVKQQIAYFSPPEYVGDNVHRQLLARYSHIWTSSNATQGLIVIQQFQPVNETSESKFSITPTLTNPTLSDFPSSFSWLSILVGTGFRKSQSIILNDRQLKQWSVELSNYYKHPNVPAIQLDVILDLSDYIPTSVFLRSRSWNWEQVLLERIISSGLVDTAGGKLSSLLFPIPSQRCSNTRTVDCEHHNTYKKIAFARQMSSKMRIGCLLDLERYNSFDDTLATVSLTGCKTLKGSFYVLKKAVVLVWNKDFQTYSFYYEDTIRKELQMVNMFRNAILAKQPLATVYLQLEVEETDRPRHWKSIDQTNFLFCEEINYEIIVYYEAILNWAKLENLPIILKTDIGRSVNVDLYSAWFSVLRRTNYPYFEWGSSDQSDNQTENTLHIFSNAQRHPGYLMRSYLDSNYNWQLDTCIDWEEGKSNFNFDDFFNIYVGTVFRADEISYHQPIRMKDYMRMLQFIFNRFRVAEFVIGNDFQNLVSGVNSVSNLTAGINDTVIYMCYCASTVNLQPDLEFFKIFLNLLRQNPLLYNPSFLKGVHIDLEVNLIEKSNLVPSNNLMNTETALKMLKLIRNSNLSGGIILNGIENCENMMKQFILNSTDVLANVLTEASYIVCIHNVSNFLETDRKSNLEALLDSHLFLKRLLGSILPHIRLHFRLQLELEIKDNRTAIERYFKLLNLFKTFGTTYDISYFCVEAFDNILDNQTTGWWEIDNFDDLSNPKSYIEKVPVYNDEIMWYPFTEDSTVTIATEDSQTVIVVTSVSSSIMFLLVGLAVYIAFRYIKLRKILSDAEVKEFLYGKLRAENKDKNYMELQGMGNSTMHMKFDPKYNLDLSDLFLDMDKILGSGAFGIVYKGRVNGKSVAIKLPNNGCGKDTFKSFLSETKILSYVGAHPNIVEFVGAYTKEIHRGILYIATELCTNGSLQDYLRKKTKLAPVLKNIDQNQKLDDSLVHLHDLNRFALEIVNGMEYIESRHLVHGDLSARNVLLDENFVCKIGDFGLSRKLYEAQKYVKTSQEPLPWKWMAYESLVKMEFTSKSDVWSYGVTIWEIYSLGKIPYAGLNWSSSFTDELQNGLRLPKPQFSSEEIFVKMSECWSLGSNDRPSFKDLINFFNLMFEGSYTVL